MERPLTIFPIIFAIFLILISGCIDNSPPYQSATVTPPGDASVPMSPEETSTPPAPQSTTNYSSLVSETTLPFMQTDNSHEESLLLKKKVDEIIIRLNQTSTKEGILKDELVELGPRAVHYMIPYLNNTPTIKHLNTLTYRTDYYPIEDAMMTLGGPEVFTYYLRNLNNSDPEMRIHSIDQLLAIGGEESFHAILPLLNDPDDHIRVHTIRALNEKGEAATGPLLEAMHQNDLKYSAAIVFSLGKDNQGKAAIQNLMQENQIDLDYVFRNYDAVYKKKDPGYELWLCLALANSGDVKMADYMINCNNSVLYYYVSEWVGPHDLAIVPGNRY